MCLERECDPLQLHAALWCSSTPLTTARATSPGLQYSMYAPLLRLEQRSTITFGTHSHSGLWGQDKTIVSIGHLSLRKRFSASLAQSHELRCTDERVRDVNGCELQGFAGASRMLLAKQDQHLCLKFWETPRQP